MLGGFRNATLLPHRKDLNDTGVFWFLGFSLLCHNTASNPITAEMHTSVSCFVL